MYIKDKLIRLFIVTANTMKLPLIMSRAVKRTVVIEEQHSNINHSKLINVNRCVLKNVFNIYF